MQSLNPPQGVMVGVSWVPFSWHWKISKRTPTPQTVKVVKADLSLKMKTMSGWTKLRSCDTAPINISCISNQLMCEIREKRVQFVTYDRSYDLNTQVLCQVLHKSQILLALVLFISIAF